MVAENHQIPDTDIEGIVDLAIQLSVSLVVVGPEAPLVHGLSIGSEQILSQVWTRFGRRSSRRIENPFKDANAVIRSPNWDISES